MQDSPGSSIITELLSISVECDSAFPDDVLQARCQKETKALQREIAKCENELKVVQKVLEQRQEKVEELHRNQNEGQRRQEVSGNISTSITLH